MKALSIRQPFADLIFEGKKTLEIRRWKTNYRGTLYICSCNSPVVAHKLCGYVLGYVWLTGIREMLKEDEEQACIAYRPEHYAWIIDNPTKINPVPIKGKQRIFEIDFYNGGGE